jgi:hypothetical protein
VLSDFARAMIIVASIVSGISNKKEIHRKTAVGSQERCIQPMPDVIEE